MRVLTYTCPWPGNLVEKNEDKHVLIQHFANANSSLSLSLSFMLQLTILNQMSIFQTQD
jgi:hypothetical protein